MTICKRKKLLIDTSDEINWNRNITKNCNISNVSKRKCVFVLNKMLYQYYYNYNGDIRCSSIGYYECDDSSTLQQSKLRSLCHYIIDPNEKSTAYRYKRHGLVLGWHKNEQLSIRAKYENDKRCGIYQTWDDLGNLTLSCMYYNNKMLFKIGNTITKYDLIAYNIHVLFINCGKKLTMNKWLYENLNKLEKYNLPIDVQSITLFTYESLLQPVTVVPELTVYKESKCVLCIDLIPNIVYSPCGHSCVCSQCDRTYSHTKDTLTNTIIKCPICRSIVTERYKLTQEDVIVN